MSVSIKAYNVQYTTSQKFRRARLNITKLNRLPKQFSFRTSEEFGVFGNLLGEAPRKSDREDAESL